MPLFDWLFEKKKKRLTEMSGGELRIEERMMARERDQLFRRMSQLDDQKKQLFERGAKEKSPDLRRTLAQQFELCSSEQAMIGRELNVKSKELITITRVRMLAERRERSRESGVLGRISEMDMMKIQGLIEDDSIKAEMYNERLDELLGTMQQVDSGKASLSSATQGVLDAWTKVDVGEKLETAFEDADQAVREAQRRQAESM